MKKVVNFKISLSKTLAKIVEKNLKNGNFATESEFFTYIFRYFLENKVKEEVKESRQEFSSGKGILLNSLKELND